MDCLSGGPSATFKVIWGGAEWAYLANPENFPLPGGCKEKSGLDGGGGSGPWWGMSQSAVLCHPSHEKGSRDRPKPTMEASAFCSLSVRHRA